MNLKLDKWWTKKLLSWPESGMGYQRVDVKLMDGRELSGVVVVNAELLNIPDDVSSVSIVNIQPHKETL